MAVFTWLGRLDSKGRVTFPSNLRDKADLNSKDFVLLSAKRVRRRFFKADDLEAALSVLKELDNIESFKYQRNELEVVFSEQ